jgi:S-DNA-T family DNA segregation ATPase FtsK/SpoIIIE
MQSLLNTIKSKINKTPLNNYSDMVIEINEVNKNIIEPMITSPHATEGIFGIEQFITETKSKSYLFSHPIFKIHNLGSPTSTNLSNLRINEETKIHAYNIRLEKPSLFPLLVREGFSFPEVVNSLRNNLKDDMRIFSQLLICKRADGWQEEAICQYEDYLKGNDWPSNNKQFRHIQNKFVDVLKKMNAISGRRERVLDIERKILESNFRIEIRLLVIGERRDKILRSIIEDHIRELDFYNGLRVYKIDSDQTFNNVIYRKFSSLSNHQFISQSELMTLLCHGEGVVKITGEMVEKIELAQEKTIQTVVNHSQQNLIDMLPIGKKKEREVNYSVIENLEKAMKRVKVIKNQKIETHNISQGATLQRITIKIPNGINFSHIDKSHKNLKAELGYESFSIEQGEEPGTVSFILPCDERDVVYLKELLENEEFLKFADEAVLPFIAGVDEIGNLQFSDLVLTPHLLVAGATGSGKSKFITQLILLLLILRKPSEMIMYLIDPKKVEFNLFNGFPHIKEVVTNMNEAENIFKSLVVEMEKRYELFAKHGVKNLTSYNKKATDKKMPFVVCVVDEYADLVMTNPEVENYIERMGQKARGAGIHLIVATQRPSTDIISGVIKANMPSKISFKLDRSSDYGTVFGKGIGYHLLGKGDGVMRLDGQTKEFIRFQSPVITLDDEEEEKVYEKIKKAYQGESVEGIEIVEKEEPIDKLKRIIATTNETRISHLQKEMGVRINTVQDLMHQLVEEGWLIKHAAKSKGYELVASQEELEKWTLH